MARHSGGRGESRLSALWGTGNRGGDNRSRGRLATATLTALAAMLVAPAVASAAALVPPELLARATTQPKATIHVIIVAEPGIRSATLKNEIMKDAGGNQFGRVRREFKYVLDGIAADVTGSELTYLAKKTGVKTITPDAAVRTSGYSATPVWPVAVGADRLWSTPFPSRVPAIAVVDTGVDKGRVADFGSRVLATENFSSLKPDPSDSSSDYSGHGTIVASLAAGASSAFPGVAPKANIVSLRVTNGEGKAVTSDVIAAADWLYENRKSYNIRVANFSLNSPYRDFGLLDPLNEAVRRLWLTGTVVVAAAGNDGPGPILSAPASEPFVITVGATDVVETAATDDDTNAPWSSYGPTSDGYPKPELAAPGRYMGGPIARTATLDEALPHRVVGGGYMWMSGTSFAAPVVAGAAAQILAMNPAFTPDQVKGALMATARDLPLAARGSVGVGQIDMAEAALLTTPPNPNAPLNQFLTTDKRVAGGRIFDYGRWSTVAASDPSWFSASWSDASWADASWADASWADVSWSDASWADASWADASWADASWADASWADASWAD